MFYLLASQTLALFKEFTMNHKIFTTALVLATLVLEAAALAAPSTGRIVVFSDKKVGTFKTDKSVREGTEEKLDSLKLVGTDQSVHACFIGSADSIKSILGDMIANSNKTEKSPLSLKTFSTTSGQPSINVEVTAESSKISYLQLKIDPC
jgi:hypothetical protein